MKSRTKILPREKKTVFDEEMQRRKHSTLYTTFYFRSYVAKCNGSRSQFNKFNFFLCILFLPVATMKQAMQEHSMCWLYVCTVYGCECQSGIIVFHFVPLDPIPSLLANIQVNDSSYPLQHISFYIIIIRCNAQFRNPFPWHLPDISICSIFFIV